MCGRTTTPILTHARAWGRTTLGPPGGLTHDRNTRSGEAGQAHHRRRGGGRRLREDVYDGQSRDRGAYLRGGRGGRRRRGSRGPRGARRVRHRAVVQDEARRAPAIALEAR